MKVFDYNIRVLITAKINFSHLINKDLWTFLLLEI